MMADIVSMAPRLRAFKGLTMDVHSSLQCLSRSMATMTTGIARLLSVTLLRGLGRNRGVLEVVERDQVLCILKPVIPVKGVSCRRTMRP